MENPTLWLIGCGPMAQSYAEVATAMNVELLVIGRGEAAAAAFKAKTGREVIAGGVTLALAERPAPAAAIVATGIESLPELTLQLLRKGVRSVLIEKPGGLTQKAIEEIKREADHRDARVNIAYNRRFYSSVLCAKKLISEDGGLKSVFFDFTEMSDRVGQLNHSPLIKERWLLANSTHVIDLAFHLAGAPKEWSAYHAGQLPWHPASAIFAGSGVTDNSVVFSYMANWQGPGRWGIELVTVKRRLILRPMEKLFIVSSAFDPPVEYSIDSTLDTTFKPGLYRQVEAFLSGSDESLCNIREHSRKFPIYERIGSYA